MALVLGLRRQPPHTISLLGFDDGRLVLRVIRSCVVDGRARAFTPHRASACKRNEETECRGLESARPLVMAVAVK